MVYELRVAVVSGNQLVSTEDGTVVGTGMSMSYGAINSDMEMQSLASISNIMFELDTTSFSFKTNGVSRTKCTSTSCLSQYITTFFTSDALVIYQGSDVFIARPSADLLNAMKLHGVITAGGNYTAANTPSAMSPIQIVKS